MSQYRSSDIPTFYNYAKIKENKNQPLDTVQQIVLDPYRTNEHAFLIASWDGVFRYYQVLLDNRNYEVIDLCYSKFLEHPIITVTMGKNNIAFAGLANGQIHAIDMQKNQSGVIGTHDAPIVRLFWIDKFNLLASVAFDNNLRFWSLENTNNNFLAKQYKIPSKAHIAAYDFPVLMIGTADSRLGFINLNKLPNLNINSNDFVEIVELGSKFTAMTLKASSKFYAFGCADGRCGLGLFEDFNDGTILPHRDSKQRIMSKAQKKSGSISSLFYYQISDLDIGSWDGYDYLVITGNQECAFFNLNKTDKVRQIKTKGTAGKVTLDGKMFVWAQGNDWSEGIYDWKKPIKPKIQVCIFKPEQLQSLIKKS